MTYIEVHGSFMGCNHRNIEHTGSVSLARFFLSHSDERGVTRLNSIVACTDNTYTLQAETRFYYSVRDADDIGLDISVRSEIGAIYPFAAPEDLGEYLGVLREASIGRLSLYGCCEELVAGPIRVKGYPVPTLPTEAQSRLHVA